MDGLEDFKDLQGNNVNDFIKSYRDSMEQSYGANVSQLQQQRRNDQASIMAGANARGVMYSNFPERSKMQYDAETYLPGLSSAYKTYQTGLDKLRSSAVNSYNAIKETQDQINHLSEIGKIADSVNGAGGSKLKWGALGAGNKKGWFYGEANENNKRSPVTFATFARKNGYDNTSQGYLDAAQAYLTEDQYNQLKRIYDAQNTTKTPNLIYNAKGFGNTPVEYDWSNRFSPEDAGFLRSLGLAFGE